MLWPIELHSTRDPWTGETNQSGFDDILPVEKVVAVSLVKTNVYAAADFRKNHQAEIFIFKVYRLPHLFCRFGRYAINEGQRIYASATALIDALLQEHGITIGICR
jgi:hypothetical protein